MVEILKLTKRHLDECKLPAKYEQVKIFCLCTGHGVGTIDFVEKIDEITDEEYETTLNKAGDYSKFKLGNLTKYFEIEIFPEHAKKLTKELPEGKLKTHLQNLKEGYVILKVKSEK
jgi:UDP-glucose 4-epimerase